MCKFVNVRKLIQSLYNYLHLCICLTSIIWCYLCKFEKFSNLFLFLSAAYRLINILLFRSVLLLLWETQLSWSLRPSRGWVHSCWLKSAMKLDYHQVSNRGWQVEENLHWHLLHIKSYSLTNSLTNLNGRSRDTVYSGFSLIIILTDNTNDWIANELRNMEDGIGISSLKWEGFRCPKATSGYAIPPD